MNRKDLKIELLAPAKDKETAIAAINAGADAVYIGYSKFGARKSAGNSFEDIREIVDYADKYRVNIYVTLNTIYNDEEIREVTEVIYKLYEIGVSAIIIQDMGILEYNLPPIRLFASTQCHNNTLEKIKFLEQTGFERVILPREFSLEEIKNITENTDIEVETFIHGALCVSYSGQCYLSYANGGRSANRGECAQPCRKKYSLISNDGKVIAKDKYLLSMKDLNLSDRIEDLILSGVTSFKIEGRLKDKNYVTNIVSYYRKKIDEILQKYNLQKSSAGKSLPSFEPNPYKSFNRGFTDFNIDGKRKNICSQNYVKSLGEFAGTVSGIFDKYFTLNGQELHNGDGICFFDDAKSELVGTRIQKAENGKIYPQNISQIKKNMKIYRNFDCEFEKELQKPVQRVIPVRAEAELFEDKIILTYTDEENNSATVVEKGAFDRAENSEKAFENIKNQLSKTGGTEFLVDNVNIKSQEIYFIRVSTLNSIRRNTTEKLREIRNKNLQKKQRQSEIKIVKYPIENLDYKANILNQNAKKFYEKRGAKVNEYAAESCPFQKETLMISKHCIKYTLGLCKKYFNNVKKYQEPYFLVDEKYKKYILFFDCKKCEMHVKASNKA